MARAGPQFPLGLPYSPFVGVTRPEPPETLALAIEAHMKRLFPTKQDAPPKVIKSTPLLINPAITVALYQSRGNNI